MTSALYLFGREKSAVLSLHLDVRSGGSVSAARWTGDEDVKRRVAAMLPSDDQTLEDEWHVAAINAAASEGLSLSRTQEGDIPSPDDLTD